MPRTIKVETENIWDAAERYERLAFYVEDIVDGLNAVRIDLSAASSGEGMQQRAGNMSRKAEELVYRLHNLCGKLRFAAVRYEDYDKRKKMGTDDF